MQEIPHLHLCRCNVQMQGCIERVFYCWQDQSKGRISYTQPLRLFQLYSLTINRYSVRPPTSPWLSCLICCSVRIRWCRTSVVYRACRWCMCLLYTRTNISHFYC
jgi:hypothetical protein